MLPTSSARSTLAQGSGLHTLSSRYPYALQQLQRHMILQNLLNTGNSTSIHHPHPSGSIASKPKRTVSPACSMPVNRTVRRRVSRACDQCSKQRTKCNGKNPCVHCTEYNLTCSYIRECKKRGKASRREIAQRAEAAAATKRNNGQNFLTEHSSYGLWQSESNAENQPSDSPSTQSDSQRLESRLLSLSDVTSSSTCLASQSPEARSLSLDDAGSLDRTLNRIELTLSNTCCTKCPDNSNTEDQVICLNDLELNVYGPICNCRSATNSYPVISGQPIGYGAPTVGFRDVSRSMQSSPNYSVTTRSPIAFSLRDTDLKFPMNLPDLTWDGVPMYLGAS